MSAGEFEGNIYIVWTSWIELCYCGQCNTWPAGGQRYGRSCRSEVSQIMMMLLFKSDTFFWLKLRHKVPCLVEFLCVSKNLNRYRLLSIFRYITVFVNRGMFRIWIWNVICGRICCLVFCVMQEWFLFHLLLFILTFILKLIIRTEYRDGQK